MSLYGLLTCDTLESVAAEPADRHGTLYLLQPNGGDPIKELAYDSYGLFIKNNPYVWLLEANAEYLGLDLNDIDDCGKFFLGADLSSGFIHQDTVTGIYWLEDVTFMLIEKVGMKSRFAEMLDGELVAYDPACKLPGHNNTAQDFVLSGRFKAISLTEIVRLKHQIKLSFNAGARYEDYPASQILSPVPGYILA